tara:strand:+ start:38492 stop:39208 length:717 start_codon:yes stop_codon:yes gene_type:complete
MTALLKSRLLNFLKILSISKLSFLKICFDYLSIKKDIANKHNFIKIIPNTNDTETYEKYFFLRNNFIQHSLIRTLELDLHKESKLSILDIGTGAGYFPYICNFYGNSVECLDIAGNEFYDLSTDALSLKKYHHEIMFSKKLPIDKKYDLICAYMICFNGHKTKALWGIHEWSVFLKQIIQKNLKDEGKIFLSFNLEDDDLPFSNDLKKFFNSFSKSFSENEILITNNKDLIKIIEKNC